MSDSNEIVTDPRLEKRTRRRFSVAEKKRLLAEADTLPYGDKDDSYDNALAETINGLYKAELIHHRGPWKSREAVELATLEWVSWFNHQRSMEPLGYIPPAETEANYYRQLVSQDAIAA